MSDVSIDAREWNSVRTNPGHTALTRTWCPGQGLVAASESFGDLRTVQTRVPAPGPGTRLTTDHTLVQALVASGELTAAEAAASPMRSVLLRALGGRADPGPADLIAVAAAPGDRLLVCSDGLSGVVPADTLQRVLTDDVALRRFLAGAGWEPDGATRTIGAEDGTVTIDQLRLHTSLAD